MAPPPPPLHDFLYCSKTLLHDAPLLGGFFLLEIGPTVTKSRDLLFMHVNPKIAQFHDLCTKHMEISIFVKCGLSLVIWCCLQFICWFWGSK